MAGGILSEVCPKCKEKFDAVEYVRVGSIPFAKYIHKFGAPESTYVQTCYVRVVTKDDATVAKKLSNEKEDFLDPDSMR